VLTLVEELYVSVNTVNTVNTHMRRRPAALALARERER
jgi:hypothetical protein